MNARDENNFLMRNRKIRNLTPYIMDHRQYLPDWWKYLKFWGHPRDFGHFENTQNTVYARIWAYILMARAWYWKFLNSRLNDDYSQNIIFISLKLTEPEKIWNVFFEFPITVWMGSPPSYLKYWRFYGQMKLWFHIWAPDKRN